MKSICFGEILYDVFPSYEVLGGAPLNAAVHLARLGGESFVISSVGNDDRGRRALEEIRANGLSAETISRSSNPTGIAEITIRDGNADYEFNDPCAWDDISLTEDAEKVLLSGVDAVVFGTLASRSSSNRAMLRRILSSKARTVLFDVNFRKSFYSADLVKEGIGCSDILKINEEEKERIEALLAIDDVRELFDDYPGLKFILLTKGEKGLSLYERGCVHERCAKDRGFVDTVGAGDSVTAAFLYFYLKGYPIEIILDKAAELASIVVASSGATSPYPEGFLETFLE